MGNEQFSGDPRPTPPGWPGVFSPQPSTPEWVRHGAALRQRHSEVGVVACFIAALVVLLYGGLMIAAVMDTRPGNVAPSEAQKTRGAILGFTMFASIFLNGAGVLVGIIGVLIPNRRKLFAWIGLGINGLLLVSCLMLCAFGLFATLSLGARS
jgi:hypothetical protein